MRAADIVSPVEPQVESPVEALVEDPRGKQEWNGEPPMREEEWKRRLKEIEDDDRNHQEILLRMESAVSADKTKAVIFYMGGERAGEVRNLANLFKVLYEAIRMGGLLESKQATQIVHEQMADRLVNVARDLVRITTKQVVHNGHRADEIPRNYRKLIADAQYMRDIVFEEE